MNVSVHEKNSETGELLPATRVELKNLNSFSSVLRGTELEINRQKKLLLASKSVVHETRTYDHKMNETTSLRSKEDQYDYRFMPEPNLLPLYVYPSRTFSPNASSSRCLNNPQLVFDKHYLDSTEAHSIKHNNKWFVDLDKVT